MAELWLTPKQAAAIMALAENNMKMTPAAQSLGLCYSTFWNRIEGIREKTRLDPRRFRDLAELEHIAMEVLHEKGTSEKQKTERIGHGACNPADVPPPVRRCRRRRSEVPRADRGQNDAKPAGSRGRNAKSLWPTGRLERLGTGVPALICIKKDIGELFEECQPPVGSVLHAFLYQPGRRDQSSPPFCALEYGGRLVVLRKGEYGIVKKGDT